MLSAINNFSLFEDLMTFNNPHEFYFVQVLMRGKDGHTEPGVNGNNKNRLVKFYTIYSVEELKKKEEEIKGICKLFNARAYIHPAKRDDNLVANEVLKLTTDMYLSTENRKGMKGIYSRACGLSFVKSDKTWVVDLDNFDMEDVNECYRFINTLRPEGDKIRKIVPTKHGYHLLTRPFDLLEFKKNPKYKDVDVHKNNPSLLYYAWEEDLSE